MRGVIVVTGRAHVSPTNRALQRHFTQPHTGAFMRDLSGLLEGVADIVFHTTASARRLDPQRGLVPVD
jgi:hypothetical protein